jgi:hypothetical protein
VGGSAASTSNYGVSGSFGADQRVLFNLVLKDCYWIAKSDHFRTLVLEGLYGALQLMKREWM